MRDVSESRDQGVVVYNALEMMMLPTPTQASQLILPRVRMLAKRKPTMAPTTTKMAVHVAWLETAFKPIETLSIPEPAMKVQSDSKFV